MGKQQRLFIAVEKKEKTVERSKRYSLKYFSIGILHPLLFPIPETHCLESNHHYRLRYWHFSKPEQELLNNEDDILKSFL